MPRLPENVPPVILSEAMRTWLRRPEPPNMTSGELIAAFTERFGLTPHQAGEALALWVDEVWDNWETMFPAPEEGYDERPSRERDPYGPLDGCEPS